jgi:hypothetical protein
LVEELLQCLDIATITPRYASSGFAPSFQEQSLHVKRAPKTPLGTTQQGQQWLYEGLQATTGLHQIALIHAPMVTQKDLYVNT